PRSATNDRQGTSRRCRGEARLCSQHSAHRRVFLLKKPGLFKTQQTLCWRGGGLHPLGFGGKKKCVVRGKKDARHGQSQAQSNRGRSKAESGENFSRGSRQQRGSQERQSNGRGRLKARPQHRTSYEAIGREHRRRAPR